MSLSKGKMPTAALVALCFWWGNALGAHAQSGPAKEPVGEAKVRALLKERLALLKQIVDETEKASRAGNSATFEDVLRAKQAYHKAELDLCDTDKERVVILEKMVMLASEVERVVNAHFAVGSVPHTAVLAASVSRLEAEIALERVKAKATR